MNDAESFRRVADDNKLREWIGKERETAIKYLSSAADPVMIHRAQGQMGLLDKMLALMDAVKTLR